MEFATAISLLEGAKLLEDGPEQMVIDPPPTAPRPRLTFRGLTPGLRSVFLTLHQAGDTVPNLMARALQTDSFAGMARLNQSVAKLAQCAYLRYHLQAENEPFASLTPVAPTFHYNEEHVTADQSCVLSRFACCRVENGRWILDSPRGHAMIHLHSPLAQRLLHELNQPRTATVLAGTVDGLPVEGARLFLNLLANAEAVVSCAPDQVSPEVTDPVLAPWEFHDLLFHTRCRLGRHDHPYGGTFPFKDRFAPLPVIKPEASGERISLRVPDLDRLKREDVPFTQVLETRASLRTPGDPPIHLDQLGEFLYRSARVKKMSETAGVSWRPSPAGGALHELEIYPLVHRCEGVAAGLYHYNPHEHALYKIAEVSREVNTLLELGRITSQLDQFPQVQLLIAARFQRIQHKYQSVSYSVILKNVGVLYQTMYLVATAMGLSACALGGGHSDLFAQAAGLNYLAETTVGEFLLNSRAPVEKSPGM
jgi:SagB-type dehydrogenase family enzyme